MDVAVGADVGVLVRVGKPGVRVKVMLFIITCTEPDPRAL